MIKAIITGHSKGLGEALATVLLDRGAAVYGLSRGSNDRLAERYGGLLHERRVDLGDSDALSTLLEEDPLASWIADADVAVLINNAGTLAPMGPLGTHGTTEIARALTLNLTAPLMLSDAFCAATSAMADRRILHVSSGAARKAYAGWSIYGATKAALDHHARAVAEEAHANLRIASVAPGVLDTSMQAEIRSSTSDRFPQRARFEALHRSGSLMPPALSARRLMDYLMSEDFGRLPATDLRDLSF